MDRSRQERLPEYYRTLHYLDENRLTLVQETHCVHNKPFSTAVGQMKRGESSEKISQNTLQLLDYAHTLQ